MRSSAQKVRAAAPHPLVSVWVDFLVFWDEGGESSQVHRGLIIRRVSWRVELVSVHQEQAALEVLHDVLTSRKYRTWQQPLEDVVLRYVELCVTLRNGKFAKDGLIQYRQICQQVNISSLETVIRRYLDQTVAAAEAAQAKAGITALDIEDLDAEETAETMLSTGTGDSKTLSDRELVNKWLKFLWETYRTVLDVLRLNAKLEPLYQVRFAGLDRAEGGGKGKKGASREWRADAVFYWESSTRPSWRSPSASSIAA